MLLKRHSFVPQSLTHLSARLFMLGRAMVQVYVGADLLLGRTVDLLNDSSVDLLRVRPPRIKLFHEFDEPVALFGPVDRPEFVIDESELPY